MQGSRRLPLLTQLLAPKHTRQRTRLRLPFLNVHISPSLTLLRLTYSAAAVARVPHGPKPYPHEPVLRVVSGRPPVANGAHAMSVPSEDLFQLIFRVGDSSPTSDVPSLSDGDSGPPSAEAPELYHGSPPVTSPVIYYNPSPGLLSPGAPFAHPAYAPWISPKPVTRSDSRKHGMSTRKLKALKSKIRCCRTQLFSTHVVHIY